ncbi:sphingosine kinase 1 [Heteronotia binoei]|uniref:sphingosine kinase 1 n=1 Tax=Heteronotia binoei TaxID=13085 RepID=UPI0029302DA9|nr:sphingosine kinase 1 [Heteronotia binoei]
MESGSGPGEGSGAEVVLSGVFSLAPAPKVAYELSLTSDAELLLRPRHSKPGSPASRLPLADCIGCYAAQSPGAAHFTLFCYPLCKGWWHSGPARRRVARTFRVWGARDADESRAVAETWARAVRELSAPRVPKLQGAIYGHLSRPCQVMVLLNPQSGSGQALHLFRTQVQPMLTEANIAFSMFITEKHNHAWELVREENLSRWDALVTMAGDGLLYEVINGLMERPDWATACQKPLCILPAGSGNAIAASLNYYATKSCLFKEELLVSCTYFLCKGLHAPSDLVSLRTASGRRLFSFLSFSWGFVSDVDITSERYRRLGSARFTLGTLQLLTTLHVYKGRLSYLPAEEPNSASSQGEQSGRSAQYAKQTFCNGQSVSARPQQGSVLEDSLLVPFDQPVPKEWVVVPEEEFVSIVCIYQSHLGADLILAPSAKLYDDAIHIFYLTAGVSRMAMIKFFMALEKGTHLTLNCPYLHYVPVKAFRLEPSMLKGHMTVDGEVLACEPVQGQIHRRLCRIICGS